MKRKATLLLSVLFAASLTPMSIPASSENTVTEVKTVDEGELIEEVYLDIEPRSRISDGDTITLEFENAYIPQEGEKCNTGSEEEIIYSIPSFSDPKYINDKNRGWYENSLNNQNDDGSDQGQMEKVQSEDQLDLLLLRNYDLDIYKDNYIPWELTRISDTEFEVKLHGINKLCGERVGKTKHKPFYHIPLSVAADGNGDPTVRIEPGKAGISANTVVFAKLRTDAEENESSTEKDTENEQTTEEITEQEETTEAHEENPVKEVRVSIGKNIVTIDEKEYEIDAVPYIQAASDSTLVPLRFVALALGGEDMESADSSSTIKWNEADRTAEITYGGNTICFTDNSGIIKINNTETEMENGVKAEIKDGRMYIPFRALGNALGVNVDWNSETKTAVYRTI